MPVLFVILFILITCFASGQGLFLLLSRFDQQFVSDRLERLFVTLLTGVLVNSWLIFILVELGRFSVVLLAIFAFLLWASGQLSKRLSASNISQGVSSDSHLHWEMGSLQYLPISIEAGVLIGWAIVASVLFFRPHQPIWGAADVGVYINYAAHIAESGGVVLNEPLLADVPSSLYRNFLGQAVDSATGWSYLTPALDVNEMSGRVFFSFYHLHPAWQAVGWQIAGLIGAFNVTPLWGILATLCFYFLLRHLLKPSSYIFALMGLAALTICALQVWFARYGTTEPLTQLLFSFGFLAFCGWDKSNYKSWLWGSLAGAAFGMTFLVRIDTFFIGLVPAVLVLLILLNKFTWSRLAVFLIPFMTLAVHGTVHAAQLSPEYVSRLTNYMWIVATGPGLVTVIAITVFGLMLAVATWFFKEQIIGTFSLLRVVLAIALIAYFTYGWFVRPYSGAAISYTLNGVPVESWNHENLIRLGWYFTPAGVFVAFLGAVHLVLRPKWGHWYVLLPSLFYLIFYTWDLRSNGIQIYAMRRYVPVVLPFIIYASISLWEWVSSFKIRFANLFAYGLMGMWLLGLIWGARGFVSRVDYQDAHLQINQIAQDLPENSIILFNQTDPIGWGDLLSLPLRFMHGHRPFVIRNFEESDVAEMKLLVQFWLDEGETVYWVDLPPAEGVTFSAEFEQNGVNQVIFESDSLESVYTHKPTKINPIIWKFQMIDLK